jgi:hypothetical protein
MREPLCLTNLWAPLPVTGVAKFVGHITGIIYVMAIVSARDWLQTHKDIYTYMDVYVFPTTHSLTRLL